MEKDRDHLLTPQALDFLSGALGARQEDIHDVASTKAGMTNRSFCFTWHGARYILRVPGEGTDKLINRRQEAASYAALGGDTISDQVLALDPETGYKLTRFWSDTHNCDPNNWAEVTACMTLLRQFHQKRYQVAHTFNLYSEIDRYETLRGGDSEYPDYEAVKSRCLRLRDFLRRQEITVTLSHIDAVPDNFLFVHRPDGMELHLIDWEYAGMHDPHVDIAMFAVYADYDREKLDRLMDLYFEGPCDPAIRIKIYCYTALSGLLWSNWCEYKKALGVDFGDYARAQYRFASEYSALALELMEGETA